MACRCMHTLACILSDKKGIKTQKSHSAFNMSDPEKETISSRVEPVMSFTKEDIGNDNVLTTILSPSGKEIPITGEVDEAMKFALGHKAIQIDEATNARLLRKTDLFLAPVMCFLYACQFMDKVSISYASVMGLRPDLNMQGDMYSWAGTAFYLGYLFFEFPASYLLQRFPVAKTVSVFIVIWGVILCLHAVPQYAGFIALRTLLGMFESAVTPAFVILTSQWYRAEEQFLRTTVWFAFNGFGTIMGSSIAYGLAIRNNYTMEAWKVLFIAIGLMTIFMGFIVMVHIPDTPVQAWFLSEEEKTLVVERIRKNNQGFGNKKFKWHQFKEALTDVTTWLYFLFALASDIPNGGLTNFGSILLTTDFGYSSTESLLMNMPGGAVEVGGCILLAYCSRWFPRLHIAIASTAMILIASCMLAFANQNQSARLAGYYLNNISPMGMTCALSCFASNTAGHTKKVTVNAIFLVGYCVGNLIGPQTFIESQAPSYSGAKIAIVVCYCISLILLILIFLNYKRENRKRDRLGIQETHIQNVEFADLTDKENPNFRYSI